MAKKAEFSIQTVKKYVFWVCIPLGLLMTVGMTYVAVGNVGKAFESRKTALDSQKSTIEKIRAEREHPNESTITEIKAQTEELDNRVQQAWKTLEKDQRDKNKWPDLSVAFSRELSGKKTFDEISIVSRELYLNYINEYLPGLELFVDRRRVQYKEDGEWKDIDPTREQGTQKDPFSGMGGGGGASSGFGTSTETAGSHLAVVDDFGEEIQRMVGTVDWPAPETRYVTTAWDSLPKSNEVWFAQEDLWVYNALLWVIKTSNSKATGPHNAVVKRIENLLIGQDASSSLSTQLSRRLGGGGGGGGMDDMGMGGGDMGGMGGMGGMEAGGAMMVRTEEDVITVKKNRRYVDVAGNPLTSDMESPFPEFNRMPVVLRLIVDQRYIPDILVNCANCAMPIDVLRVVINPGESRPFELTAHDASAVGGGGDDMGGDMMGGGMGMGGGGMGGGGARGGGMGAGAGAIGDGSQLKIDGAGGIYGSNAVPIEIYGCINIFNPVELRNRIKETE